ncbi:bactofilin family protein [Hydrogenophaga sp.]|uniref:bactofilin family protein n=1 Tax=Hydrogenophaga sp. TaxID=1904254 RepID=UPI003F6D8D77
MNDSVKNKGNIVLGEGVRAVGSFSVPGTALIEGFFEGDLTADELMIGRHGQLLGRVHARQAEILGETRQDLHVTGKLIVRSTGRVHGAARYGELEVERGGALQGSIKPLAAVDAPTPLAGQAPAPLELPAAPAHGKPLGPT